MSKGGEQAFPLFVPPNNIIVKGMTYRRYLAAHIAGHMLVSAEVVAACSDTAGGDHRMISKLVGKLVWEMADDILAEE